MLVEASASMRSKSEAVMLASDRGHIKLLRNLVAARANMGFVKGWGSDGTTAGLRRTSAGGHTQVARMLLAASADVDLGSYHLEIACVPVTAGTCIDSKSEAIVLAAERGHTKLVRILVAAHAHLDSVSDGTTALMRASHICRRSRSDCAHASGSRC